jgi:hypothetical protein
VCISRVSPSRRTLGCYAKGGPPILYVPIFPRKYFLFYEMRKKRGNEKRFTKGKFLYSCVPLRFWEHPRAHALKCPSLGRKHHTGTSPRAFKCSLSIHHLSCMARWWVLIHSGLGEHLHMVLGPLCSTIRCGSLDTPYYV